MVTDNIKIPLFPLGVVLLPGMHLPLHIFEERYKQMIAECLKEERPFGIVLFDGQSIHSVGCMARITKVLKRFDDGQMDIMTRGGKRFVVQQLIDEKAYLEAWVRFFDDVQEEVGASDLPDLVESALELFKQIGGPDMSKAISEGSGDIDLKQLAYAIAASEGFTPAERQSFLEMTSPSERLQKCAQALSRIVARNRLTREIQKAIGGNGSPPRSILGQLEAYTKE